jgi:mono/diheme cytochrome c family protein
VKPLQVPVLAPVLALLGLAFWTPVCLAQAMNLSGDAAKGEETAARLCASCHSASPSTGGHPPSLAQIANTPHYSIEKLRRIIAVPPHRGMPSFPLKQEEINDIAAYLRSLRKPAS